MRSLSEHFRVPDKKFLPCCTDGGKAQSLMVFRLWEKMRYLFSLLLTAEAHPGFRGRLLEAAFK